MIRHLPFWLGFIVGDVVGCLTLCFLHLLFGVTHHDTRKKP
jgi:hypothetical protein